MLNQHREQGGRLRRYGYGASIAKFLRSSADEVIGSLTQASAYSVDQSQVLAWKVSINDLRRALSIWSGVGHIFLEYDIPRLGRRVDAIVIADHMVFVVEFKVGASSFLSGDIDQVVDYALDLKHFHEPSHVAPLVPVLVATDAPVEDLCIASSPAADGLFHAVCCNGELLAQVLSHALALADGPPIDPFAWIEGQYRPTPTIVEAALALYARHSVTDISRSDAANLGLTSGFLNEVISHARSAGRKAICLVTGVPGAGKTLVGLDVATQSTDALAEQHAVYLSGNGPLVQVLQEALARDRVRRESEAGHSLRIGDARRQVKSFIQNVHFFRDEALLTDAPPHDHVAIFDEAQRAWNAEMTADFMKRKKGKEDFNHSEPEFLISYLDRHDDWAVVICLVGTGQEINRGEAGVSEWIGSINRCFPSWDVYVSPQLETKDEDVVQALEAVRNRSGSTPILRILSLSPILGQRSVHVQAQTLQP